MKKILAVFVSISIFSASIFMTGCASSVQVRASAHEEVQEYYELDRTRHVRVLCGSDKVA